MRHRHPPADDDSAPLRAERQNRMGIAAADELRKTVASALTGVFGRFLVQLPPAFAEKALAAPNDMERVRCEDFGRSVAANGRRWMETFLKQVDSHLVGEGKQPLENPTTRGGVEDAIALAGIELRAETMHAHLVAELDARLDRVRQSLYLPVYGKALAPAALCRALQETADQLGCPPVLRRILFEKFEQIVILDLKTLYRSLIEALNRLGREVEKAAPPKPGAAPAAAPAARQPEPPPPQAPPVPPLPEVPPSTPPHLDPHTTAMLQGYARTASREGYNDGSLALDLLALENNKPVPGVATDQRWVPLQRMSLAGQFLNNAIADPLVAQDQRPEHEQVRFPLVKSALTDATLFTAITHPLRSLVNELMLKSATSRITGSAEARRMAEQLQQVLVQFDLAPDFVREAMLTAQPIDEQQIQRFFEQQRQQAQERRDHVINEAKRLVIRELELHTFARAVPQAAVKFLNGSWGPLLVKRLLKHGAGAEPWKQAVQMMEELLDQLDVRDPLEPPPSEWTELCQTMGRELASEGLPAERVAEMLKNLEEARTAR